MNDVLNTVNHTTVEALGFKYAGRKQFANEYADEFTGDKILIRLFDNGACAGMVDGKPTSLTLDGLKSFLSAQ